VSGVPPQADRWSPIDQFDRGLNYVKMPLVLKYTTAHVSWFGAFWSLIIVIWDLPALLNSLVRTLAIDRVIFNNEDGDLIHRII
jgi:hypothetical protein